MYDRPAVADEVAVEPAAYSRRQELRRLELLDNGKRLRLSPAPRIVVAREGEEDDESSEDRETAGQYAENPRGPISVREVAALGRPPANEEHHCHGHRVGNNKNEGAPEEIH